MISLVLVYIAGLLTVPLVRWIALVIFYQQDLTVDLTQRRDLYDE